MLINIYVMLLPVTQTAGPMSMSCWSDHQSKSYSFIKLALSLTITILLQSRRSVSLRCQTGGSRTGWLVFLQSDSVIQTSETQTTSSLSVLSVMKSLVRTQTEKCNCNRAGRGSNVSGGVLKPSDLRHGGSVAHFMKISCRETTHNLSYGSERHSM